MKTANTGDIIKYGGIIYEVCGYSDSKTLILQPLEDNEEMKCPHCGKLIKYKNQIHIVENSMLFQNGASEVLTLKNK